MTDATSSPVPAKAGLWEDFIDIFYQPSQVFERRREGKFGAALVVLMVISGILFFALYNGLAPIMDAEMAKQAAAMAAKNSSLTPDQISGLQNSMEKFAVIGYMIAIPVGVAVTAAVLWLAGKLVNAKVAFVAALMIATYSQVPRLAEMVLNAIQGLALAPESINSRYSVSLGIARFLDVSSTNPFVLTILDGLDVFTIWTTALLAIGLAVVARIPVARAAFAAAAVWVVVLLPALYAALSQG
ncbi:MAG: YIP1 family protein [Gemmatimonadaceae bacterium]|nr:YIP1 family protein [Gemmatimonadaceae bacterium]